MDAFELNDEQLEMVSGGSGFNFSGHNVGFNVNIDPTVVIAPTIVIAPFGKNINVAGSSVDVKNQITQSFWQK
jgi:hypothetical protein